MRAKSGHRTRHSLPTTPTTQQKPGASCDARLAYITLSFVFLGSSSAWSWSTIDLKAAYYIHYAPRHFSAASPV
jgi:hypothetical protein